MKRFELCARHLVVTARPPTVLIATSEFTTSMAEIEAKVPAAMDLLPSTTSAIPTKIAIDIVAAGGASFLVSPFITTFDRAIIENANGSRKMNVALRELSKDFARQPLSFIKRKEFLIVYGLYLATYATANTIETVCETSQTNSQIPKLLGTSVVNISGCITKDRLFAQMFSHAPPHKFPLRSMGLFALRDSMTVGASFVAPPIFSAALVSYGMDKGTANSISQLVCPAVWQLASTPLHLLGLDLYNRTDASLASRTQFISREYIKSSMARIARIVPAFGLGGIGNMQIRSELRSALI
ncbi:hypothetical protein AeRB84_020334 [Aphanomyces euteiches]|nr:hypothetical protein AeRB84_020334 [Aphanomyces euteiches]